MLDARIFSEDAQGMTDDELHRMLGLCDVGSRAYAVLDAEIAHRALTATPKQALRIAEWMLWLTLILVVLAIPPAYRAITG